MLRCVLFSALVSMVVLAYPLTSFSQDAPPKKAADATADKTDKPADAAPEVEEVEMPKENAATINNFTITTRDLFSELTNSPVRRRQMLYEMIRRRLVEEEAKAQNVTVTDDEVEKLMAQRIQASGGEDTYKKMIETGQVDPALERDTVRLNLILQKLCEKDPETKPTDDDIQRAFRLQYGEKVKMQVVLMKEYNELLNVYELLTKGGDFGMLAGRNSTHQTRTNGGYMPEVPTVDLPDVLKKNIGELKEHEFTKPFQMNDAWWLVKLLERRPPDGTVTLDQKKDDLTKMVKQAKVEDLMRRYFTKLIKKYKVKLNKELVKVEVPVKPEAPKPEAPKPEEPKK